MIPAYPEAEFVPVGPGTERRFLRCPVLLLRSCCQPTPRCLVSIQTGFSRWMTHHSNSFCNSLSIWVFGATLPFHPCLTPRIKSGSNFPSAGLISRRKTLGLGELKPEAEAVARRPGRVVRTRLQARDTKHGEPEGACAGGSALERAGEGQ